MPQSLAFVVVHLVFSTQDRKPLLGHPVRRNLHAYIAGCARSLDCESYSVGGTADHVHIALRLSRQITVAEIVGKLKAASSKWIKKQSPDLVSFAWQSGYGAFSVGPTDLPALRHYIETQEEHHRKYSFQDELLAMLKKYDVEYDERYLWQ